MSGKLGTHWQMFEEVKAYALQQMSIDDTWDLIKIVEKFTKAETKIKEEVDKLK